MTEPLAGSTKTRRGHRQLRSGRRRILLAVLATLLVGGVLVACGDSGDGDSAVEAGDAASLRVIATTTILGDIAENVVGGDGTVEALMAPGQDPHTFGLSARQAADLRDADLVVANGLGLEAAFTDVLIEAERSGTPVIFVAELLDPIPRGGPVDEDEHAEAGSLDPHVWLDPLRMAEAARLIARALEAVGDGGGATGWTERGQAYAASLEQLDVRVEAMLAAIPLDARKLVTNHDALGYFADRYRFDVVDVVIPGGSTLAEPSARDIAELAATIQRELVVAIFVETSVSDTLASVVADEAGEEVVVVALYTGSLGEAGSGAETYVELIRTNAERIAAALGD